MTRSANSPGTSSTTMISFIRLPSWSFARPFPSELLSAAHRLTIGLVVTHPRERLTQGLCRPLPLNVERLGDARPIVDVDGRVDHPVGAGAADGEVTHPPFGDSGDADGDVLGRLQFDLLRAQARAA